ncbi:MAG: hypothetical protein JWO13_3107 [Acidobacteriales bacterium]|nr:hypothetical protein [Terriglobales bacterium]
MMRAIAVAGVVLLLFAAASAATTSQPLLDSGYRDMYNLNFSHAHSTFTEYEHTHPQDPFGHVSNAAAYLFGEFDRLRVLEFDLFTADSNFESRPKNSADPAIKKSFDEELAVSDRMAQEQLAKSPNDINALFALILADGLRGDYASLMEKKNSAGLNYMKRSRGLAERLLILDPTCYDAYLAVGVENYLLGLNAAPVRWMLRITGAQTDKQQGIEKLRLAATKGHYLAPFARLLLAVAAMRDKDSNTARYLLQGLSAEFPQNELYKKELARIQ